jgi:hypothetical protein
LEIVPGPRHEIDEHVFERWRRPLPNKTGAIAIRRDGRFQRLGIAARTCKLLPNGATISTPELPESSAESRARVSLSVLLTVKVVSCELRITSSTVPRASTSPKAMYAISWQRSASSM